MPIVGREIYSANSEFAARTKGFIPHSPHSGIPRRQLFIVAAHRTQFGTRPNNELNLERKSGG